MHVHWRRLCSKMIPSQMPAQAAASPLMVLSSATLASWMDVTADLLRVVLSRQSKTPLSWRSTCSMRNGRATSGLFPQCTLPLKLHLTPRLLVGLGAHRYAKEKGLATYPLETEPFTGPMVTDGAIAKYHEHKKRLGILQSGLQDTVGAVCIDRNGNCAASVSSGGISLKHAGRVGDSAVIGSGCWAQNPGRGENGFACSTTGTGEQIMQTILAHGLAKAVGPAEMAEWNTRLSEALYRFCDRIEATEKAAGFISIGVDHDGTAELWYGHTTHSLGLGYMSDADAKPTSLVSRKDTASLFRLAGHSIKTSARGG